MLVGRKNCRKIVQFLVEPLMMKQSISPLSEWIFLYPIHLERINQRGFNGLFLSFKSHYLVMNLNFKLYFGMIVGNRISV